MPAPITLLAETAADIMTAGPVSLEATATVAEAAQFLTARGFGAAVVIDAAGHAIGVVTKTDLLIHARGQARGLEGDATEVRGVMTPAVFSVRTDAAARSVIDQLLALNVHHLFVTDASGVVVGVISPVDVLRKLG
jgi:CBS-domain-containing membrane protein